MAKIAEGIAIVMAKQTAEGTINTEVRDASVIASAHAAGFDFGTGDVDTVNDEITQTAHGLETDDGPFRASSTTTLPAGLAVDTNYYIIKVTADTVKLSLTRGGAAVDITDTGTGTHTLDGAPGILIRDESLTLDFDRLEDLGEEVTGTFTKTPGTFRSEDVGTFTFDISVRGSGQTLTTPVAGEYDLPGPIELLYEAAGLIKGTPTSSKTPYEIGDPTFNTIKVWRRDVSYTMLDCRVASIAYALSPQGVVIATVAVSAGSVTKNASDTFPTVFDYNLQESTAPPTLKGAAAQIGSVVRGFLSGTLTVDNAFEKFPDSNAATGMATERDSRTFSWSGEWYVDTTDPDQDYTNLVRESDPTEDLFFRLGTHQSSTGEVANAIEFNMKNVNWTKVSVAHQAGRVVYNLEGYATGASPGDDEFWLDSV
jgi:hypothetical protein